MTAVHGPERGALCFEDPTPLADTDRRLILAAIARVARDNDGHVDPNIVRACLTGAHGELVVHARRLSGSYRTLRLAGVLAVDEPTVNTDTRGGNAGKWLNTYRLVDPVALDAMRAAS